MRATMPKAAEPVFMSEPKSNDRTLGGAAIFWSAIKAFFKIFGIILIIAFVVGLLLGVACGPRANAVRIAHEVGVSKLRDDLVALVASPEGQRHEISQNVWPESVRKLQPLAVQHHMSGVLIVLNQSRRQQAGLLVMLDSKDEPGPGGSGVDYDTLGDGLFWCSEKIRTPYIPPDQRTNR